jgi:hypothetical protein
MLSDDYQAQSDWWASMTPEQQEDYEDALERDRLERHVYGRTLTEAERADVIARGEPAKAAILARG